MGLYLGLANGDVPKDPYAFTPALARAWSERGVRCLAVGFRDVPQAETARAAVELRPLLTDHGIHISQYVGINAHLAHVDQARRADGIRRIREAVPAARALDATMMQSGVGTNAVAGLGTSPAPPPPGEPHHHDAPHHYAPHPDNYSPAARDGLVRALREVATMMADEGMVFSLECHQLTTMRSARVIRDVLDEVDSPAVVANFDPVNLLDSATAVYDNAARMRAMADVLLPPDGVARLGPSCHVKDVVLRSGLVCHIDEEAPGAGVLDLSVLLELAQRLPTGRREG
ncbi:MAG TPA: TIM barrel protein, partial [Bacillota bacterium]|nr:TIM barrel protein [Bacillota bacterium]